MTYSDISKVVDALNWALFRATELQYDAAKDYEEEKSKEDSDKLDYIWRRLKQAEEKREEVIEALNIVRTHNWH